MKSLSYDLFPRKTAHGYVHDENANLLGGISAHAGLFSNAEDLGKYGQMLLNDGMVGDKKIIDKDLLSLFTTRQRTLRSAVGYFHMQMSLLRVPTLELKTKMLWICLESILFDGVVGKIVARTVECYCYECLSRDF